MWRGRSLSQRAATDTQVSCRPNRGPRLGLAAALPLRPDACDLPGGDVEPVINVGGGDPQQQAREGTLVVVPGGLVPDRIRHRVGPVGQPGDGEPDRLRGVAYRMLGSAAEADDAVQEAWLRVSRSGAGGVENLAGWLTTITARVCLNMLQARRSRPEELAGAQPPEPAACREGQGPEDQALLADSVGLALLAVLDTLSPARAATSRPTRTLCSDRAARS
jgi:Sigma-70 region 2